jgi:hypothetical protein
MERTSFQGVINIVRFNWHFYAFAGLLLVGLLFLGWLLPASKPYALGLAGLIMLHIGVSLGVSFYIYDCSNLYKMDWFSPKEQGHILNINAGFDETSQLLQQKFPQCTYRICDFYDPQKHTEISIRRARKAYPPLPGTMQVATHCLPFAPATFDEALAILSAHEIREEAERVLFFKELASVLKPQGSIYVTEHLRDFPNFMAYTIGFFHFHSKKAWMRTFSAAGLSVHKTIHTTPFVTTFILHKNGNTL